MTQAAMYIKRNPNINGLDEATTWLYDTTQVELIQQDNDPAGGTLDIFFEGAQLLDSEGFCLTRGLNPIDGTFIMYVDECVDYGGDPDDLDNIDTVKRQTWIIENTQFTDTQFIVRATCEEQALKRIYNNETKMHSHEIICGICSAKHFDVELVGLEDCVNDNPLGINECLHQLVNTGSP